MTTRAHVYVAGKVQGVFFRATTRDTAQEHGVNGWVKNLDDGRVEAVFEGDADAVQAMINFCHDGPERARVDEVTVDWEEPEAVDGFRIIR